MGTQKISNLQRESQRFFQDNSFIDLAQHYSNDKGSENITLIEKFAQVTYNLRSEWLNLLQFGACSFNFSNEIDVYNVDLFWVHHVKKGYGKF